MKPEGWDMTYYLNLLKSYIKTALVELVGEGSVAPAVAPFLGRGKVSLLWTRTYNIKSFKQGATPLKLQIYYIYDEKSNNLDEHNFDKPNDLNALNLMNKCARWNKNNNNTTQTFSIFME